MEQAERTDQSLPGELSRREKLKAKLEQSRQRIEERAQQRAESKQAEYERKVKAR